MSYFFSHTNHNLTCTLEPPTEKRKTHFHFVIPLYDGECVIIINFYINYYSLIKHNNQGRIQDFKMTWDKFTLHTNPLKTQRYE